MIAETTEVKADESPVRSIYLEIVGKQNKLIAFLSDEVGRLLDANQRHAEEIQRLKERLDHLEEARF